MGLLRWKVMMVMMMMMIGPKKLLHSIRKAKKLMISYRGRFCFFLICAVACAILYFTYVLNSSSNVKARIYDLDEAVIQTENAKHASSEVQLEDSIERDFTGVRQGQNSSHAGKSTLDHVTVTSAYGDQLVGHRDSPDVTKVSNAGTQKSKVQLQNFASDTRISRVLPTRRQEFHESSRQEMETSRGSLKNPVVHYDSNFKLLLTNKSIAEANESAKPGPEFPGMTNEMIRRIEENLISWKRKEESRLMEERKILEEGKRKLLEEKTRFQQEMGHVMQELHRESIVKSHQKLVSRPHRRPVDSSNWEGLNNTFIDSHYPGIVFLEGYRLHRPFVAPDDASAAGMQGSPKTLGEMLDSQAEERFLQVISEVHLDCIVIQRMGSLADGGWDVCTVPPYDLKPGCVVYSFGINYDFTFDDAMASSFDCAVKTFDPSMSVGDHVRSARVHFYQLGLGAQNTVTNNGWNLSTFRNIRKKLGHDKGVIDILKIDIEFYEWECMRNMISDNSLENVKQLMFEMHTPEVAMVQRPSTKEDFAMMYDLLSDLEKAGFRRYNVHVNPLGQYTSSRTGKTRSCCFELYYVNIRFLKLK